MTPAHGNRERPETLRSVHEAREFLLSGDGWRKAQQVRDKQGGISLNASFTWIGEGRLNTQIKVYKTTILNIRKRELVISRAD